MDSSFHGEQGYNMELIPTHGTEPLFLYLLYTPIKRETYSFRKSGPGVSHESHSVGDNTIGRGLLDRCRMDGHYNSLLDLSGSIILLHC